MILMLAVACFLGGIHFERKRLRRANEAALAAARGRGTLRAAIMEAERRKSQQQAIEEAAIRRRVNQAIQEDEKLLEKKRDALDALFRDRQ